MPKKLATFKVEDILKKKAHELSKDEITALLKGGCERCIFFVDPGLNKKGGALFPGFNLVLFQPDGIRSRAVRTMFVKCTAGCEKLLTLGESLTKGGEILLKTGGQMTRHPDTATHKENEMKKEAQRNGMVVNQHQLVGGMGGEVGGYGGGGTNMGGAGAVADESGMVVNQHQQLVGGMDREVGGGRGANMGGTGAVADESDATLAHEQHTMRPAYGQNACQPDPDYPYLQHPKSMLQMQNGPNKYGGQLALPANNDALQGYVAVPHTQQSQFHLNAVDGALTVPHFINQPWQLMGQQQVAEPNHLLQQQQCASGMEPTAGGGDDEWVNDFCEWIGKNGDFCAAGSL